MTILLLCFFLGCVTGLRSLMAPAVICWAAHFGWLHFAGTKLAFFGHPAALTLFTVLALLELIADKLPKTPARTAPQGLIPRILFGGFTGAALAVSAVNPAFPPGVGRVYSVTFPVFAGVLGAVAGAFAGYHIRHALVTEAHQPDFAVALAEDAIAIAAGFLIVSHL